MPKSYTTDSTSKPQVSRRGLAGSAAALLGLAGAAAGGAFQGAAPAPSFYATLDPEQQAAFDELRSIVKAQADGTYVAPPNPDAALIALCAEYIAKSREFCSVGQHTWDMKVTDPEWIRCDELGCAMVPGLHALEKEITDTPARTLAGVRAKAEAARHQLSGDADREPEPMDRENALVWSLVQETLAVLGRA